MSEWRKGHQAGVLVTQELDRFTAFLGPLLTARTDLKALMDEAYTVLAPIDAHKKDLEEQIAGLEARLTELHETVAEERRTVQATLGKLQADLEFRKAEYAAKQKEAETNYSTHLASMDRQWQQAKEQDRARRAQMTEEMAAAQRIHQERLQELRATEKEVQRRIEAGDARLQELVNLGRKGRGTS